MKRRTFGVTAGVSALALVAGLPKSARAGVSQAQADQLKTTLTPFGAERAGNADGSIPAWTGGYTQVPAGWSSPALMPDLFANEQPIVTINAGNMAKYSEKLPESVKYMMQNVGFSIVVYPTHRTAAAPQYIYDNIYQNALNAQSVPGGARIGFVNAYGGVPFPILSSDPAEAGAQAIQNHNWRWSSLHYTIFSSAYAMAHGQLTLVLGEQVYQYYPYYQPGGTWQSFLADGQIGSKTNLTTVTPPNVVGNVIISWEPTNSAINPDSGWQLLTGQGRVRRIPEIQYDIPDSSLDGITTYDEAFVFLGALDEFDWKLIGKKEMYVPYNTNKTNFMESSDLQTNFLNPEVVRWELHRVLVVEATLHPGKRNIIPHRRFYVDEDTWTILVSDEYDANGNFWKMSNFLLTARPDLPGTIGQIFCTYNVQDSSYIACFCPDLSRPASQRTQDFVNRPAMSVFNPQAMAARSSF